MSDHPPPSVHPRPITIVLRHHVPYMPQYSMDSIRCQYIYTDRHPIVTMPRRHRSVHDWQQSTVAFPSIYSMRVHQHHPQVIDKRRMYAPPYYPHMPYEAVYSNLRSHDNLPGHLHQVTYPQYHHIPCAPQMLMHSTPPRYINLDPHP